MHFNEMTYSMWCEFQRVKWLKLIWRCCMPKCKIKNSINIKILWLFYSKIEKELSFPMHSMAECRMPYQIWCTSYWFSIPQIVLTKIVLPSIEGHFYSIRSNITRLQQQQQWMVQMNGIGQKCVCGLMREISNENIPGINCWRNWQ